MIPLRASGVGSNLIDSAMRSPNSSLKNSLRNSELRRFLNEGLNDKEEVRGEGEVKIGDAPGAAGAAGAGAGAG